MFKLNIECSKDFDELHIKFKDGSMFSSTPDKSNEKDTFFNNKDTREDTQVPDRSNQKRKSLQDYLDVDAEFGCISDDIVEKPMIADEERPAKVADELQNFDF
jgi:hypothetical protein